MQFLLGGLILVVSVLVLRRVLRLGAEAGVRPAVRQLPTEHQAVYTRVEVEVETQLSILSVVLNDAIEERNSGRHHIAWRLVKLANSQWEQVTQNVTLLLDVVRKNANYAHVPVSYKGPMIQGFKSKAVINQMRVHELLIQLAVRSQMRFYLQVDMLRRAATNLFLEFQRTSRYGEMTEDRSAEVWQRLDFYLHDLDVLAKEALLALRACLAALPEPALQSFLQDAEPILRRGVRGPYIPAGR